MKLPLTLQKLLAELSKVSARGYNDVVPSFGVFIDTHRDQPHIGTFGVDIHRGSCRPIVVDLVVVNAASDPAKLLLMEPDSGLLLELHEKHLFITQEFWGDFLTSYFLDHGQSPLDSEGVMVTSHLRDPRAKVYKLKSFRQMLEWRHAAEKAGTKISAA